MAEVDARCMLGQGRPAPVRLHRRPHPGFASRAGARDCVFRTAAALAINFIQSRSRRSRAGARSPPA
eukprot:2163228-Pyramimonas_sp.AAC.1